MHALTYSKFDVRFANNKNVRKVRIFDNLCVPFRIHSLGSVQQNSNSSVKFSFGMHMYPFLAVKLMAMDLFSHSVLLRGQNEVEYTGNL